MPSNESEQFFADTLQSAGIPVTESDLKKTFEAQAADLGLVFQNAHDQSPWWRFLKSAAVSPAHWLIQFLIQYVMPNQFVKTASGGFLDRLAWVYGLTRKPATQAEGVIRFDREALGSVLTIPKGTIIQTAPINGQVYRVISQSDVFFGVNDLTLEVPVKAEYPGAAYNLAANYYLVLPNPIRGIARVTNTADWLRVPGDDAEFDAAFRLRIRGHFSTVSDHHVNSLYKSLIAERAGIQFDRIFIDHTQAPRGPGSADAFVLFDLNEPAQAYLDDVNAFIRDQGMHGHGDDIQVKAMPEQSFDLVCDLYVGSGLGEAEKPDLARQVEQMIRCAFRENSDFEVTRVWPFERFSFAQLGRELFNRWVQIADIQWNLTHIEGGRFVPRLGRLQVNVD